TVLTLLGTLGVLLLVGSVWRGGPRSDPGRHVQLAMLPLATGLASPHTLGYDLVPWLASGWLLVRYAEEVPAVQRSIGPLLLVGWWGATLSALPGVYSLAPWGAWSGLVCLVVLFGLLEPAYRCWARQVPRRWFATK